MSDALDLEKSEAERLATIAHPLFRTYGYQGLFNAVAAAVRPEAYGAGISVRKLLLALIAQDEAGRPFAPPAESNTSNPSEASAGNSATDELFEIKSRIDVEGMARIVDPTAFRPLWASDNHLRWDVNEPRKRKALAKAQALRTLILGEEGNSSSVAGVQAAPDGATEDQRSAGPFSLEAQLTERLADPEWLAKWNVAEEARLPFLRLVIALRREEGDTLTLLSDNPDFNGRPNNAVECCGAWTDWKERRFEGDTLHAAVLAAYRARHPSTPAAAVLGEAVTRRSAPDEPLIQPRSDTPSPAGGGEP